MNPIHAISNRKAKVLAVLLAAAVLLLPVAVHAQLTTATIVGTVTDSTGAVIPGAEVTATNTDTHFSRTVSTNATGDYRLEFLPIGDYTVLVSAKGFESVSQGGVVLTLNEEQHYNAALKIGTANQSVIVTTAPPLVETTDSVVGRSISNTEVDNLPLVGRNVYNLVSLVPGVQSNSNNTALGFPQQVVYINGGTDNEVGSVSYYLDGGVNMTMLRNTGNILPNPDALQEMNVLTNSYNALYGRMSSGIVNVVTKSGTNTVHGSVFEFLRNDRLNAYPLFANASNGKGHQHRNQFGATLGGPLWKDKTFFFGSYGGLRQNQSSFISNILVPTNAERNSGFTDFSDRLPTGVTITSCTQTLTSAQTAAGDFILCQPATGSAEITGPGSNKPIPNNKIGPGTPYALDPAALNILTHYIPAANGTNPTNGQPTYSGYISTPQVEDEFLMKVDHNLTKTQRLEGAYFMSVGSLINNPGGSLPMFWSTNYYPYRQQNINLSDTWTISDRKINQTWFNYTRMIGGRVNEPATSLQTLGSAYQPIGTPSLPQVTVTSFFTLSQAIQGPKAGTNFYSLRDIYTINAGKHSIGLGAEGALNKDVQLTDLDNYGVFSFTAATQGSGSSKTCLRTCVSLGDFALGLNSSVEQDTPVYAIDNSWTYGFFGQDDWKIRKNLTLNLGMRWDLQTPPTDPQNKEATWVPGQQSTVIPSLPTGLLVVGDKGVTRGIITMRLHHFSPRVGFAYDPFSDGKTAIRGAFGVFYGMISGNEWNATSNFQPFATRDTFTPAQLSTFSNPYANFAGGVSPFSSSYNPQNVHLILPNSVEGINPNYQWPYSYQMNLSVQRQLSKDFSVTVSYIGNLSHDLPTDYDANAPQYSPTQTAANVANRRPLYASEQLTQVYVISSGQSAHYHAGQVDFDKRLTHSFSLKGYYTWSKTMESASLLNTTAQNNPQNFNAINEDYGRTSDDLRHRFVTSIVWKPDYFKNSNWLLKGILDGWTISAISTIQSGTPFTVSAGTDVNLDGNTNDRASIVPGASFSSGAGNNRQMEEASYFNKNAFCDAGQVISGTSNICPGIGAGSLDGNSQLNGYSGPGYKDVDGALFRDFPVYSRVVAQLRVEGTNILNLVNLSNPNSTLSSSTVTQITSGAGMRQLQVGARILF